MFVIIPYMEKYPIPHDGHEAFREKLVQFRLVYINFSISPSDRNTQKKLPVSLYSNGKSSENTWQQHGA